jgi:CRP-like cAMP-binding protein
MSGETWKNHPMPKSGGGTNLLRIELGHINVLEYVAADELLRSSPLLAGIPAEEWGQLLQAAKVRSFGAGQIILSERDTIAAVGFVLEGCVSLSTNDGACDLGTLGKGDVFGLAALFPDAVRLQARSEDTVHLVFLPVEPIRALLQRHARLEQTLRQIAAQRRTLDEEGARFLQQW